MSTPINSSDRNVLKYLINQFKPQWKLFATSLICGLIITAASLIQIDIIRVFMDDGLKAENWGLIVSLCIGIVIVFLLDGLVEFGHRFTVRLGVEKTIRSIRNEIFEKLLTFSHVQASKHTSGKAVSRILTDTQALGMSTHIIADLIKEPLMIVGTLAYLLIKINWKLTLICLITLPLVSLVGKAFSKSARRNQGRIQNSLEESSNHIVEAMGGLRTAHSLGQTHQLKNEFNDKNEATFNYLIRLAKVEELVGPITKWVTSLAGAFLALVGGYMVTHSQLTMGELTAFIAAAGRLIQPLKQINQLSIRTQQLIAVGKRVCDILSEPLDELANDQTKWLKSPYIVPKSQPEAKDLEWREIFFAYPKRDSNDSEPALAIEGISLKLERGKKLALVGRSGSGKSTLSLLAMRFLDPQQGLVLLGQKDAKRWELPEYRQHFSYVSQDVFLFNRSIKDNLLLASPHASETEIWQALERAQIKEYFSKLPQKLDTVLGEHANTLSGGEKQRLAIARAFLKNSPILILDEATSQLDSHSEAAVQAALKDLMKDRSVLIIAHRLSTVRDSDCVAVLDKGRVLETGHPKDLLGSGNGAFATLWNQQFSHT